MNLSTHLNLAASIKFQNLIIVIIIFEVSIMGKIVNIS